MATIQINDQWRIKSDPHQWMLQKFAGIDKKGKEKWNGVSYWSTIGGALKDYVERGVRLSDAQWRWEVLDERDRLISEATRALNDDYKLIVKEK